MSVRPIAAARRVGGRLIPPPSKSVSNRYLNLALLAARPVSVERLLVADDTACFLAALESLGWSVEGSGETTRLIPGEMPPAADLWCGASGTMLRFLVAATSTLAGQWRLDGTARLRERPLAPELEALRALGASIECPRREGLAPLEVRGGALAGGAVDLDAGESSQFASAVMMAATGAAAAVDLTLTGLVSGPYLDLTQEALDVFGARLETTGPGRFRVHPGLPGVSTVRVEGDYSSAAYWAAGAALVGGSVELAGLAAGSRQADRLFFDILADMGLKLEWRSGALRATGGAPLTGVDRDLSRTPDQVPTLAVLAPYARGVTRIRNVAHLRLKESDRLSAVTVALRAAGATVTEEPDGLVIPGIWADRPAPTGAVTLDPADDHRLAMSFAILGLGSPGISVSDAGVVAKSYPGFWRDFETFTMS